ncbi:hypothetical protein N7532_010090 [Penicillium argentinense]|uniref:Zn(2)-C6 fungal-type domain-containing protein n=1 Tax=Penicillium argentinense TaxID=1131581 RepID=A0A9W9JXB3_9EURO|nr:uncharacterized protein N7532_010090 [Penicillium argentinense]KAJ5085319.1 hypothetical protein N7532_010090 [Penicillium argentinense]
MTPTPPSTTSSSGHSPEFRVIRKRNRVPLSCAPCRHRKLKCNRSHPCENCVKRGDGPSCTYAQAGTRKKNSPQQNTPTSPDDMQNRIDRLEGLVLSLMTNGNQSAGPTAALAAISGESTGRSGSTGLSNEIELEDDDGIQEESDTEQVTKSFGVMKMDNNKSYYISEAHWASVLNDISEVRNFFSTHKKQFEEQAEKIKVARPRTDVPESTLLFGAMKPLSRPEIMSSLPSKYTADLLVARYFNTYDPATHILHGPTFQAQYNKHWEDPTQTEIVWIAMLFAMMRLAMLSYYREGDEPPEFRGKAMDMAGSFRNSVAQCLTLADYTKPHPFLIESLVFHLHGDYSQTWEADVSVWVLAGVITRLAMRMGYHRDSKMFPNITPFQGEMRRRVWSFVATADQLFSFQVGMPSMLRAADMDTDLPRNLYDDDFDENCKELPPPRQLSEPTPISYLISKARLVYAFGRVNEQASSLSSISYDKVMELDADLRRARELIPDHLLIRPMEECGHDPVNLIMSRFSVTTIYLKAQCVLHRPYIVRSRENPRFTYSRRTCIDAAMELLDFQAILHTEMRSGRLRGRCTIVTALNAADFLLAATIVCLDLYQGYQLQSSNRPSGDIFTWGRERRDEMMAALQRSKEIWDELRDKSMEAFKASSILGVMLTKIQSAIPGSETTTANVPFEPQDEKQNAAMTLGLLSSGMSPMNPGPAPYSDTMFKMEEPPMPGVGSTAEMPGPASPFSSMFGQMPDMQLNLDWNAWDTYLQNPGFETPNQFWPMMDNQRQPMPQSLGLTQPPVTSPMGTARVPTMPNSVNNVPNGQLPRSPNMFSPSSNSPESGGSSIPGFTPASHTDSSRRSQGYCLRRASSRLLSASQSRTVTTRTQSALTVPPTSSISTRTPTKYSVHQLRWNSTKEPEPSVKPAEQENPVQEELLAQQEQRPEWEQNETPEETAVNPEHVERKRAMRMRLLDAKTQMKTTFKTPESETIYVGNLFYDIEAEDLRARMEQFGPVIRALIVHDNRGLSKGFGYVQFTTIAAARAAVENMHLQILEGRQVVVQFSRSQLEHRRSEHPPSNTLFIGNIPLEFTDRDVQDVFRDVKNLLEVRFAIDRRSGSPRGFAHAEFLHTDAAMQARELLSGKAPYGRKLKVDFTDRKKVSFVSGENLKMRRKREEEARRAEEGQEQ